MDYRNILVYRIGHLGDTIVSLPAFWAVRNKFPRAKMTLLTNSDAGGANLISARSVLPPEGLFDEWMTYQTPGKSYGSLKNLAELFFDIRQRKFDSVVYLSTRNRSERQIERDRLFFRLAGIKNVIGIKYLKDNLLRADLKRPLPEVEAESRFLVDCLASDGIAPETASSNRGLLLTEDEQNFAEFWLEKNCRAAGEHQPFIGIAPSSKWASKIWDEDRYFEVVSRLIERTEVFPIVFGGREDRETGERLIKRWRTGANAAGELNVRQAAAALARCRLYLGNDTGTMHLAAAVGTPCVAVFSAIDFAGRWRPFGEENFVFRSRVECEGCYLQTCPFENKCLRDIQTEEVFQACLTLLEKRKLKYGSRLSA